MGLTTVQRDCAACDVKLILAESQKCKLVAVCLLEMMFSWRFTRGLIM